MLEHNKYMYIPRLNYIFIAVSVVKLYVHTCHPLRKVLFRYRPSRKKIMIFDPSKWTDGLTGAKKKKGSFCDVAGGKHLA